MISVLGETRFALPLRRPVLVTALGAPAARILDSFRLEIGGESTRLRLLAVSPAAISREQTNENVAYVPSDGLESAVEQMFIQREIGATDRVSWIVLLKVGDDSAADELLINGAIPCAARLSADVPFTLTILLVDPSVDFVSPHAGYLATVARLTAEATIAGLLPRVHVIRARLGEGFRLDPPSLDQYAALACRVLVLSNAEDERADPSTGLLAGNPHDFSIPADGLASARVFARLAVQRVRTLAEVTALQAARQRLQEFAESVASRSVSLDPSWSRPQSVINTPQARSELVRGLYDTIREGPATPWPKRPALLGQQRAEYQRIGAAAERWVEALDPWARETRRRYGAVVDDLRRAAGRENERVRASVLQQVTTIWADRAIPSPLLVIEELVDRQKNEWTQQRAEASEQIGKIEKLQDVDSSVDLTGPLDRLEKAMCTGRSPKVTLGLAVLGVLAAVFSFGMLFLSALPAYLAIAMLILAIGLTGRMSLDLYRAKSCREMAFDDLTGAMRGVLRREADATERRQKVAAGHLLIEVNAQCADYLPAIEKSVNSLGSELHTFRQSNPAYDREPKDPFTVHLPGDAARTSKLEDSVLRTLTAEQVTMRLRTNEMASNWLSGDAAAWVQRADHLLREEAIKLWYADFQVASDGREAAIDGVLRKWPKYAANFLSAGNAANGMGPQQPDFAFASGRVRQLVNGHLGGDGTVLIEYASRIDELLLCQIQPGLDANAASR